MHKFEGHTNGVISIALSTDRKLIYSGGWDKCIRVYNVETFELVQSIPDAHEKEINAIVAVKDGYFTASSDRNIKKWTTS